MPLTYFIDHFERNEAYTEICIKRIYLLALKALLYLQNLNVVHGSLSGDSFFITFKKNGKEYFISSLMQKNTKFISTFSKVLKKGMYLC
jgi:hypothetical protein